MDEPENQGNHNPVDPQKSKAVCDQSDSDHVDDQNNPQTPPYHPQRTEQKSCQTEPFRQEDEPLSVLNRRVLIRRWFQYRKGRHDFVHTPDRECCATPRLSRPQATQRKRGAPLVMDRVIRPSDRRQPPSVPLVEGTSPFPRGSNAAAARKARASPLKQDSDI
jgi:hypothetical protein